MKASIILWTTVLALSLVAFKEANSSQPPIARTGAPGEGTCAGCHGNASPPPTISLTQNGQPLTIYTPGGSPVTLTLTVSHPSLTLYGFQLTVLSAQPGQENVPNQGLSTGGNPGITLQTGADGRRYIAHQGVSTTGTWTFEWTPPATDVGPITWYIAANAVNGNGSTSGDAPGTATITLNPDQSANLPVPISIQNGQLYLAPHTEVTLYTLDGRKVGDFFASDRNQIILPEGIYIAHWRHLTRSGVQKLWVNQ